MADDLVLELARFIERVGAIARTGLAFKPDGSTRSVMKICCARRPGSDRYWTAATPTIHCRSTSSGAKTSETDTTAT
jgi:hypothetical protein